MRTPIVFALAAMVAMTFVALRVAAPSVQANSPGTTWAPLLSCPNVDGSSDGSVGLAGDILAVAMRYQKRIDIDPEYHIIYDRNADGYIDLSNDIVATAMRYQQICPLVDTQVAQATQWAIANVPKTIDESALAALGYYQGSFVVPGQGVHFVNLSNWDGTFNPTAPEGLVYQDGELAALLYVTDGTVVGWGTHQATSYPPPSVPHNVDLEGDADGPQCSPACSWAGTNDGWHMHYYLCTTDIGTSGASALPGFSTAQNCQNYGGGDPACTIPVTTTPCYRWAPNVGWMGHLWDFKPNPNKIPDQGGDNGRFADCTPDGSGWKAFNCPA